MHWSSLLERKQRRASENSGGVQNQIRAGARHLGRCLRVHTHLVSEMPRPYVLPKFWIQTNKKTKQLAFTTLAIILATMLLVGSLTLAQPPTQPPPFISTDSGDFFFPPYPAESDRVGLGLTSPHDAGPLKPGWYLNWGASPNPVHPAGAEYARTIHFAVDAGGVNPCKNPATHLDQIRPSMTGTTLIQAVSRHPGALWLVGNEPDSIYNGSPIQAELYAELYHHFYQQIKAIDPGAKVAIGAVVQPSALRMQYLERVLTHYQTRYATPLPTDLWNIHFYILNEGTSERPCGDWGSANPPFITETGLQIAPQASVMLDVAQMEASLRTFRTWMQTTGYGDKPLIITEMGSLFPPDYAGFEDPVIVRYLGDVFNMFRTATDPTVGLASDRGRLVQMWAWFSTHHADFGGDLFISRDDPTLSAVGKAFAARQNALFSPYIDLQPIPPTRIISSTEALTIRAYLQNRGNVAAEETQVRLSLVQASDNRLIAETERSLGRIDRRYAAPPVLISHTWRVRTPQLPTPLIPYTLTITLISPDANAANNQLTLPFQWYLLTPPLAHPAKSASHFATCPPLSHDTLLIDSDSALARCYEIQQKLCYPLKKICASWWWPSIPWPGPGWLCCSGNSPGVRSSGR